jgi:putative DNA primase/helicase
MNWENYDQVLHQMDFYGLKFRSRDLNNGLQVDKGKKTCGVGGKWWYRLHTFAPDNSHRRFIVGSFGCYKTGERHKVEWDKEGLSEELRAQYRKQAEEARERERIQAEEAARYAAMTAAQLWAEGVQEGSSPYLERKGVPGESCRYLPQTIWLARPDHEAKRIMLPAGTLVLPLIRYDRPRAEALRGLQLIKPDGFKIFTEGLAKSGCAIRLGQVDAETRVVMVCEGYATGLSIRMATGRRWPVYVALDAYNLVWVVEILRGQHPAAHLLLCADDDWKTSDHDGPNPGRNKAKLAAKTTPNCDFVWPVFDPATREEKDTDFNDLHQREGLEAVERQLLRVLDAIEKGIGRRGA